MRTVKTTTTTTTRLLGAAALAIATMAPAAHAAAGAPDEIVLYEQDHDRAWLMIDGHKVMFSARGSVAHAVADALCAAGHHAWVEDGCVFLEFSGWRPRFSIGVPGYRFSTWVEGCTLVIRPERIVRHHRRGWSRPRVIECPPPACDLGVTVRLGGVRLGIRDRDWNRGW
jgi:hypothetical protein